MKKISLNAVKNLSRAEMKKILAGSQGACFSICGPTVIDGYCGYECPVCRDNYEHPGPQMFCYSTY